MLGEGYEETHMTYQNDPRRDFDRPMEPVARRRIANEGWGTGSIILASLAAVAIIVGLFYAIANRDDTATATRTDNRPAVTSTAPATNPPAARETTGSGATNRATEPTGSKPAGPTQVPAPASSSR
jgi:uncharacterized protein HemX